MPAPAVAANLPAPAAAAPIAANPPIVDAPPAKMTMLGGNF